MASPLTIVPPEDPGARLRLEWADSLREHMAARSLTRKGLVAALEIVGCAVSVQAVGQWLRAETSPRPHHQAAIAAVMQAPVRRIFPIEALAQRSA